MSLQDDIEAYWGKIDELEKARAEVSRIQAEAQVINDRIQKHGLNAVKTLLGPGFEPRITMYVSPGNRPKKVEPEGST